MAVGRAVVVTLCVVSLAVLGCALPMDPRVGRERGRDAPDTWNHPNVDEGQYRHPRMPDTPGLDLEEYERYWQEMAKDNPCKPLLLSWRTGQCGKHPTLTVLQCWERQ